MRTVAVPREVMAAMRQAADVAYPEECCGFLCSADGAEPDGVRRIVRAVAAPNRSRSERERRYVILPEELRVAETEAASRGDVVSGFYHSHPDHPARPSTFDQEHAWPWYVYLILASGGSSSAGAFELDPDRREFRPVELSSGTESVGGRSGP